jgi:hypothetical protein
MTEHLFFYEEQPSNIPQESVDILAQPSWSEFCHEAKNAESAVAIYDLGDNDSRKRSSNVQLI